MGATYKFCRAAFPFFRIFLYFINVYKPNYPMVVLLGQELGRISHTFVCIHSEFGRLPSENAEVALTSDKQCSLQARSGKHN